MAIKVKDVMKVMNTFAPLDLAMDWDNCGLVVGDINQEVKRLYIAIDVTIDVVNEAINNKADMIITHHPLLIHKINQINTMTLEGQKFIKLIQNNISLYCAHTNLDQVIGGINDLLAKKIGLVDYEVLEVTGMNKAGNPVGFGRIGLLDKPITLNELALKVKSGLELDGIRIVGEQTKVIQKVAIGSGSSMEALQVAMNKHADLFITGDVKYHGAMEAKEKGICLIDASHFGTENIVRELLNELFSNELPQLELVIDNILCDPIKII